MLSTGFDDTLRTDLLPTGVLIFTRDQFTHQQLSLFNHDASQIILFSFVSETDRYEELVGEIAQVMSTFSVQ